MVKDALYVVLSDGQMYVRCDDLVQYLDDLRVMARSRADQLDAELHVDVDPEIVDEVDDLPLDDGEVIGRVTESCMQSGAVEALDTVIKELELSVSIAADQLGFEQLDVCIVDKIA